jgi:hypothetical protein
VLCDVGIATQSAIARHAMPLLVQNSSVKYDPPLLAA